MAKSDKLTAKQEAFAVEYVDNGGNASAAYRHAYDAERMTERVVWNEASKVAAHRGVSVRIDALQDARKKVLQWTDMERLVRLKMAADDEDHRAAIAAIAEANKMLGSHAPAKQEVTGKDGASLLPTAITKTIIDPKADGS